MFDDGMNIFWINSLEDRCRQNKHTHALTQMHASGIFVFG